MKLPAPTNANYAAVVVAIKARVKLDGLDNLVGIPVLGHQALTQNDFSVGELRVAFTSETQLSEDYCALNNLYRDQSLNRDLDQQGYLEKNRRVRALKLRGHVSNALLMPLDSLAYTKYDLDSLMVGDTFDTLNGHEVCKKYEVPRNYQTRAKGKIEKAFRRVDNKIFPEHIETDQYWRNRHLLKHGPEVVLTQKLHGTSWRGGNVPVMRSLRWYEKLLRKFRITIPTHEYSVVFGSRKVIKDPNNPRQQHYYDNDIWTEYGKKVADLIPEGYLVYGELIGFTPDGGPLQGNYTYHLAPGNAELFVYRVAFINRQGILADLSWEGVKEFCRACGMKWVPELLRLPASGVEEFLDRYLDQRLADFGGWNELPLVVSSHKTVDEGVCIRQDALVPLILKAKSPKFLEYETRLLDKGEADLESIS